jgi:hypothetical protein
VWLRDDDEGKGEGCCRGLRWLAGTKKRPARWENIKRDMTIYGNVTQSFSSTVAAAAEANVPFSFPFLFLIWIFGFSLWVFLLTWIRLVRWFVRLIVGRLHSNREKKEPKEKPIKRPIVPMLSRASTELVD